MYKLIIDGNVQDKGTLNHLKTIGVSMKRHYPNSVIVICNMLGLYVHWIF